MDPRAHIEASEAKKLGRQVRGFDPSFWDRRSLDIVTEGNVHPHATNPELWRGENKLGFALMLAREQLADST